MAVATSRGHCVVGKAGQKRQLPASGAVFEGFRIEFLGWLRRV